jgi:hypothetical protein
MKLSIMTLGIMTLSITIFDRMAFSVVSNNDAQLNDI